MMQKIRRSLAGVHNEKGFTLIEMAIVLIIIGIIIGAVVKGKDVMKSAEQKRLYTTFVREWQVAYNNYYDRTGWILGDDNSATNATRNGQCANSASDANLESQLTRVGLTPPATGPTGLSTVRSYTDVNGVQHTITLRFAWNANIGNHIRLTATNGMPIDWGLSLDRIIDGTADGTTGDLQYDSDNAPAATQDTWPSVATAPPTDSRAYLLLEF